MLKIGNRMIDTPNIFNFATGELSQDAFLAWLSSWACSTHKNVDVELNSVAREFLSLLTGQKINPKTISKVWTRQQHKKTDVLVFIDMEDKNEKHLILIEDKIGSGIHNNQLKRYKEKILNEISENEEFKDRTLHLIYYKTEDHITDERQMHGFVNISRKDVLGIFETSMAKSVKNQIFIDYARRLRRLEDESCAYQTKSVEDWEYAQWSGFLMALCQHLGDGANFGYVSNRSGGFIGAWFEWMPSEHLLEDEDIYFQIHAKPESRSRPFDLTIRISSAHKDRTVSLKNAISLGFKGKLDIAGITYSDSNLRAGKSMRILSFPYIKISTGTEQVSAFAAEIKKIREVLET